MEDSRTKRIAAGIAGAAALVVGFLRLRSRRKPAGDVVPEPSPADELRARLDEARAGENGTAEPAPDAEPDEDTAAGEHDVSDAEADAEDAPAGVQPLVGETPPSEVDARRSAVHDRVRQTIDELR